MDAATLGRFLPAWQGADRPGGGADALVEAVTRLQGVALPASILESDVLASRVRGYRPADLDALCAGGELVWMGAGALGADDGRVVLCFRDQARLLLGAAVRDDPPTGELHDAIRAHLAARGASFWPDLVRASGVAEERRLLAALWDLVWAGEVTNDTLAPLRAFVRGASAKVRARPPGRRPHPGSIRRAGLRPAPGDGRSSRRCSNPRRAPRRPRTPARSSSWTATASSRARPSWRRTCREGSPASIRSFGPWRRPARCGAGTSWPGSAPRSSRCPARSIACGRCAEGRRTPTASRPAGGEPGPWPSPRPTPPSRTEPRCRGRTRREGRPGRPAPTSSWWAARPSPTWSAAPAASSRSARRSRYGPSRWPHW